MKCLNCSTEFDNNYCPSCGQKASTHRFSLRYVMSSEIIIGAFMVNKGFLFTLKELFTRPGHSIREYLLGKRSKYFNAFSLLILLIAISYFVNEYSDIKLGDLLDAASKDFTASFEEFMANNPRLVYLINIPLMAITSFLFFRKSKINFAENIVLNTYVSSALLVLSLPFTLLTVFYSDIETLSFFLSATSFASFGYSMWVYYQFFSAYEYNKTSLIFRSLLAVGLSSILQGIVFAIIVWVKTLL